MIENPIRYYDTEDTEFIINDATKKNMLVSPYYFIKVDSVDGFWGGDISAESHPIPGADGERSGDTFRRGRTLTFSGTIYARGLAELREGARYLHHMLWDISDHRKLVFQLWNDGFQLYLWAKPIQDLAIVEQVDGLTFRSRYTFALRSDEPYNYKVSDDARYPAWLQ
jgi:hypothetical protein